MKPMQTTRHHASEKGVALLIAIFALMLISAVAISLVLMSDTGTAIDANYRNSTKAFYGAVAGLEEARGRMAPGRVDSIFAQLPSPMSVSPAIQAVYIVNPAQGEVVAPTNLAANNPYADNEFGLEWGISNNGSILVQQAPPAGGGPTMPTGGTPVGGGNQFVVPLGGPMSGGGNPSLVLPPTNATVSMLPAIPSDYQNPAQNANLNGPLFKWVRITGETESSTRTDVNGDGVLDNTTPIYEINGHRYLDTPANAGLGGNQVYRVTALAVMPDKSRRMLEYDVVMNILNFNLPSPLTLAGPVGNFKGANSNPYHVNGTDGSGTAPAVPGCVPTTNSLPAVGTLDPPGQTTNKQTVVSGIPSNRQGNYTGDNLATPSVADVSLTAPFDNPADLDNALKTIQQNANVNLGAPGAVNSYSFSDVTNAMPGGTWPNSNDNPQIIYVDGNFDLGPNTGSGLLVVTGNLTYQGNSGWNGLILVVGQGTTTFQGSGGGNGQFDGGIFVATTKDSSGNQLSSFGQVNFDISGGGGNGIYYNSCWISNSANSLKRFQTLSFREALNF